MLYVCMFDVTMSTKDDFLLIMVLILGIGVCGSHGYQTSSACCDRMESQDLITTVLRKMKRVNIIYDNTYELSAAHLLESKHTDEIQLQILRADNGNFSSHLYRHVNKVLLDPSLSSMKESLNFVLLCDSQTVKRVITQAETTDNRTGMRSLLRHFSKWLIVQESHAHLHTDTLMDNVARIIGDLTSIFRRTSCSGKFNQFCTKQPNTTCEVATLMWTPQGRGWASVCRDGLRDDQILSTLYPNTLMGLNGRELSLTLLEWLPMSKRVHINNTLTYIGAGIDIAHKLSVIFNFSYTFVEPADQQWGDKLENSSWSGVVGMLQRQEADMCPVNYAINYERSKVMEISFPIMQLYRVAVYRKSSENGHPWLQLVSCFHWMVYVCSLVAFIWTVLWFHFIRHVQERGGLSGVTNGVDWIQLHLSGPFRQGLTKTPWSCSLRTLSSTWFVFCVMVTAVYSGNLIAIATVKTHVIPFRTLQELADQSEYSIGAQAGGYATGIFKVSKDPVYRKLWAKIQESMKSISKEDQDDMTYQRSLVLGGKYVLITTTMVLDNMETDTCEIAAMKERFMPSHSGLAFPRNSPLLKLFNKQLMSFVEEGLIAVWVRKWMAHKKQCGTDSTPTMSEFKLNHLKSVFVVCGACVALAAVVLLLEISYQSEFKSINNSIKHKETTK